MGGCITDGAAELMRLTLEVGVPLRIQAIKRRGGLTDLDFEGLREFPELLGYKGDVLQFPSERQGEAGELMAQLIDAIAVLACVPGGVDFLGRHWEA
jgi:hypothetical protein